MADISREALENISKKYKTRFGAAMGEEQRPEITTEKYQEFKQNLLPKGAGWYEKACKWAGSILKMSVKPEKKHEMQEYIEICHLDITPEDAEACAVLLPLTFMVVMGFISFVVFGSLFFAFFFVMIGALAMIPLRNYLSFTANAWRMKASNQMVLCVFYIVTYMRHTSNLEGAINFASNHLSPPLSLDMKKVIWDVETEKYPSVRESLDAYLETWRKWNMEFVEAIHLIESSLYEGVEERRSSTLDKALDVILTETYEKMLHYAHNLKSPITILHMMGIIMPILGLVILPLVVSFLEGIEWYHLSTLYNIILPLSVFYIGKTVLAKRPTGYGDTDLGESQHYAKYRNLIFKLGGREFQFPPMIIGLTIIFTLVMAGLTPLMAAAITDDATLLAEKELIEGTGFKLLGYRQSATSSTTILGPYGVGSAIISLAFPLAFGLGIGVYYLLRSRKLIKIRNDTKRLETEFASALFQLGSRLGDGMPAEMAFGKVGENIEGTVSGKFFNRVSTNIHKLGMGLHDAIFNPKTGAILSYPSNIIDSSMKVLIESIRKGPRVASQALMNISRYIKEIHRVDERLKDLMADIIASMNSQINFMAPAISGIVIGITSMITTILGSLRNRAGEIAAQGGGAPGGVLDTLFGDSIPTYYFQIVVGVYVVQIIYILTILSNGIENGSDKLNEEYMIGKNMIRAVIIYCTVAFVVMILFNFIAGRVVAGAGGATLG